jgi:hypothetical protein
MYLSQEVKVHVVAIGVPVQNEKKKEVERALTACPTEQTCRDNYQPQPVTRNT